MTAVITTDGLQNVDAAVTTLDSIQWAAATGTANALAAAFPTAVAALVDGLILGVRASAANTTATPTFSPDSLTAHVIKKGGGVALVPGDINASGHELLLRYHSSGTYWELLNPYLSRLVSATWAAAAGTVDALTAAFTPPNLALTDGQLISVRAAGANATTTPTLAVDGLTARTITRQGNQALNIGDIYGAGHELLLRYVSATPRWELLNPAIANRALATEGMLWKSLASDDTGGTNVNTAQPWFPTAGAVTVKVGTYRFRGRLLATRTAGANAHTTGVLFAGSATYTGVYEGRARTGDANALAADNTFRQTTIGSSLVVKAASSSTTEDLDIYVEGVIVVTVAGTVIPQFIYSVAPGGTPTIKTGTWFEMIPVTNPTGTWA